MELVWRKELKAFFREERCRLAVRCVFQNSFWKQFLSTSLDLFYEAKSENKLTMGLDMQLPPTFWRLSCVWVTTVAKAFSVSTHLLKHVSALAIVSFFISSEQSSCYVSLHKSSGFILCEPFLWIIRIGLTSAVGFMSFVDIVIPL